jgi:hypothetical protein
MFWDVLGFLCFTFMGGLKNLLEWSDLLYYTTLQLINYTCSRKGKFCVAIAIDNWI